MGKITEYVHVQPSTDDPDEDFVWPASMNEKTYDNACALMSASADTLRGWHPTLLGRPMNNLWNRRSVHRMFHANVGRLKRKLDTYPRSQREHFLRLYFKALVTR